MPHFQRISPLLLIMFDLIMCRWKYIQCWMYRWRLSHPSTLKVGSYIRYQYLWVIKSSLNELVLPLFHFFYKHLGIFHNVITKSLFWKPFLYKLGSLWSSKCNSSTIDELSKCCQQIANACSMQYVFVLRYKDTFMCLQILKVSIIPLQVYSC